MNSKKFFQMDYENIHNFGWEGKGHTLQNEGRIEVVLSHPANVKLVLLNDDKLRQANLEGF